MLQNGKPTTHNRRAEVKVDVKAKIIQLVMTMRSIVNDRIRKYAISPNQASLIAQGKANQIQTLRPPVSRGAAAHILKHSVISEFEQTGRATPSVLTFQIQSYQNLNWQPGGMRDMPRIWIQVFQFGET